MEAMEDWFLLWPSLFFSVCVLSKCPSLIRGPFLKVGSWAFFYVIMLYAYAQLSYPKANSNYTTIV